METKKKIIDLMYKSAEKVHSSGSCGELGDSFQALDSDCFSDVANQIYETLIKDLEHHKRTTIGLYATDKEPEKIFVHLIKKIGMDGEKTFGAMDYDYYKEYFNKGIKLLMFRIS
jgi:hypothetical protein